VGQDSESNDDTGIQIIPPFQLGPDPNIMV